MIIKVSERIFKKLYKAKKEDGYNGLFLAVYMYGLVDAETYHKKGIYGVRLLYPNEKGTYEVEYHVNGVSED